MDIEKTRTLILKLSKTEPKIMCLVKEFQNSNITEDDLISGSFEYIIRELNEYRAEQDRIDMLAW